MTSVEDRLRAAMQAAAGTVPDGTAPPLRLPRRWPRVGPSRLRGRVLALAAPVAAAAAVIAVVAGALVVRSHLAGPRTGQSAAAAPRVPPRYLVALTYVGQFKSWKIRRSEAVVASTATGRTIATVAVPKPYNSFVAVSGAYDDRTFVLAAQQLAPVSSVGSNPQLLWPATRFYALRINPAGPGPLTVLTALPIPVLPPASFGDMALSPDGSRLAVTQVWSAPGSGYLNRAVGLRVYSVGTGSSRSWPLVTQGSGGYPIDIVRTPSWEANGRLIALTVSSGRCLDCVRLLDTSAAGHTIQAASRIVVRSPDLHTQVWWTSTIVTPDGSRVLRSAIVAVPVAKNTYYDVPRIYAYSVRTGRAVEILRGGRGVNMTVLWSSPDGHALIVSSSYEGDQTGYLSAAVQAGRHWTGLRLPAGTLAASW